MQPSGNRNHVWIKLFMLLGLVAGVSWFFYQTEAAQFFLSRCRMESFLQSLGQWALPGFVLLQALQVVAAPIPGDVTGLMGGYLYGPLLGIILSTLGLTVGSMIAFVLSRSFGKPFVRKFIDEKTLKRFDYLLHHRGAFLVFILFLIPGFPKDYLCYILGLGDLSLPEFVVIGGTGRLFGTVLLTLGGNYIRLQQYGRFFVLLGAALLLVLLGMAYKDRLESLFKELHHKAQRDQKIEFPNP